MGKIKNVLDWKRFSLGKKAIFFSFLGLILAAFIGGGSSIFAAYIQNFQSFTHVSDRNSLSIASEIFNDKITGNIFAIPENKSFQKKFSKAKTADEKAQVIRSEGYIVLYQSSDLFSSIDGQQFNEMMVEHNLNDNDSLPLTILALEIWNINQQKPLVVDEVSLILDQYSSPAVIESSLYIIPSGPQGGGTDLDIFEYSVSLDQTSTAIGFLRAQNERIVLGPGEGCLIVLYIAYNNPGEYKFHTTISYHLPNGKKFLKQGSNFHYSWVKREYISVSDIQIVQ